MSDCGCVYSGEDGALPEFSTTSEVIAKKSHKCDECGETIQAKSRYQRVTGKWDGRVDTFKTCVVCAEIRSLLFCEGWTYGLMWEDIRESWWNGLNPMGCINQLESVAAREKLAAEYRDYLDIPDVAAPTEEPRR